MKYKVGDKVRITTEKKGGIWNNKGKMDKWLGKVMTIRDIHGDCYRMKEDKKEFDGNGWLWDDNMIDELVEAGINMGNAKKKDEDKKEGKVMNNNSITKEEMIEEIESLLDRYDHDNTSYGVSKIYDTWYNNKYVLREILSKHPMYNGRGQIVLRSTDYTREVGYADIRRFVLWAKEKLTINDPYAEKLKDTLFVFTALSFYFKPTIEIESEDIKQIISSLKAIKTKTLPHDGERTARFVGKLCRELKLNTYYGYESEYAKYADAINPITLKRTTVMSVNPLDYLTMSFGNSWASCHTIDKTNVRGKPNSYEGQYCSGTLSYMLDETSMVVYTISDDYKGNNPETQEKITRCMFHYGEDKLIQGRMYPQSNDGDEGVSKEVRLIVQKVLSECLDVPNYWNVKKGTEACEDVVSSEGTHYRDYESFSTCNVSMPVGINNDKIITIGHEPICPKCGCEHSEEETLCCAGCSPITYCCAECGDRIREEDVYWCNGDPYCEDCTFYCDYHRQYEPLSDRWGNVEGYGEVCEYAIDEGEGDEFIYCDRCGEIYYNDDGIYTEDNHSFCCENCAERSGYIYDSETGEWVADIEEEVAVNE